MNDRNNDRTTDAETAPPNEDEAADLYLRMLRATHGYGDEDPVELFEKYRAALRRARESPEVPDDGHIPDPDSIKMPGPGQASRPSQDDDGGE